MGEGDKFPQASRLLVASLAIGTVLRMYKLGSQGLWIDEGYSLRDAALSGTIAESSKPLYFSILEAWMTVTPHTAAWLRMPAVIFGVACIWLTYIVARKLASERAAAFAALASAISPLYINHSQEIRMYTLLTALVLSQMYFFLLALEKPGVKRLAPYGLFTLLAVLTQPLAALIVVPQALFVITKNGQRLRTYVPWLATGALVFLFWLPVLINVFRFRGYFGAAWTLLEPRPGWWHGVSLIGEFLLGAWDIKMALVSKPAMAYLLYTLVIIGIVAWTTWSNRRAAGTAVALAWLAIPVITLGALSHVGANLWVPRYMIYISPALFVLLGMAVARQRKPWIAAALAVFILALPAARVGRYYLKPDRPGWPQVAAYLEAHAGKEDRIGIYRSGNRFVFRFYYDGPAQWQALGPEHLFAQQIVDFTPETAKEILRELPAAPKHWLAVSGIPLRIEEQFQPVLRERYRVVRLVSFRDINLYELVNGADVED